jgi:hypothetical protein
MKNLKKLSREELKNFNGGLLAAGEACPLKSGCDSGRGRNLGGGLFCC